MEKGSGSWPGGSGGEPGFWTKGEVDLNLDSFSQESWLWMRDVTTPSLGYLLCQMGPVIIPTPKALLHRMELLP